MSVYYQDELVTLHHGDMRDILPTLGTYDAAVADPPYGETDLPWDTWPPGWPSHVANYTSSLWCFGSLRMFLKYVHDFADWRLSQDVIWEKHNGSGFAADRFMRVHELATHWYRGTWSDLHHDTPRVPSRAAHHQGGDASRGPTPHRSGIQGTWVDDGTRLQRSVIHARSMNHLAIAPTEKPVALLDSLIRYACPPGGVVIDPFSGSGSTLEAARQAGRHAVGIEADGDMCHKAADRLRQTVLETP